ncbi:hypothetical protein DFH06DRAFT_558065 [Mycena polygramma]|nr:hypothetical protein DFH06DRAFT_558065 [Mycena polygramma]
MAATVARNLRAGSSCRHISYLVGCGSRSFTVHLNPRRLSIGYIVVESEPAADLRPVLERTYEFSNPRHPKASHFLSFMIHARSTHDATNLAHRLACMFPSMFNPESESGRTLYRLSTHPSRPFILRSFPIDKTSARGAFPAQSGEAKYFWNLHAYRRSGSTVFQLSSRQRDADQITRGQSAEGRAYQARAAFSCQTGFWISPRPLSCAL